MTDWEFKHADFCEYYDLGAGELAITIAIAPLVLLVGRVLYPAPRSGHHSVGRDGAWNSCYPPRPAAIPQGGRVWHWHAIAHASDLLPSGPAPLEVVQPILLRIRVSRTIMARWRREEHTPNDSIQGYAVDRVDCVIQACQHRASKLP